MNLETAQAIVDSLDGLRAKARRRRDEANMELEKARAEMEGAENAYFDALAILNATKAKQQKP
jgi:hypothetical protein